MAGIKGQPAPKASQLSQPVPGQDDLDAALAAMETSVPPPAAAPAPTQGGDALDQALSGVAPLNPQPAAPTPTQETFDSPWYTEALPAVGGVAGGMLGAPGGPLTSIGGAALGGAIGQSFRDLIETQFLGKKPKEAYEGMVDITAKGAEEGAGQVIGMGIAKGLGLAAKGASNYIAAPVKQYFDDAIKTARGAIEEPLTKLLAQKGTSLSAEAAGDSVKGLLKENIKTKYGGFVQAYTDLDEVTKAIPIADQTRRGFTMKLKEWAASDLGGDNFKMVKKFTDELDAASFGKQFDDVIKQINDARSVAFRNGATNQAQVLGELRNRATDFMESETTKLASRIQAGKATPQEMGFLTQIMKQRGIQEPDPTKYAKSLAGDFLKSKDKVRADYAEFKGFLEDIAEQTKTKITKKGPMTFLNNLDDVPSEQLIEKMFQPKNAAALRKMQEKTPEVFDVVARTKVTQLMQKASPDGVLDLPAFRKEVYALPEGTRNLLFSADDLKTLNKVVSNPKIRRIESLSRAGDSMVKKWTEDILTVTGLGIEGLQKTTRPGAAVKQVIGSPAAGALSPMLSPQGEEGQ